MKRLLGDNVFVLTMAACLIPALAVLFVGLNLLIRDGPYVTGELQFLELIGGGGGAATGIFGMIHAWLAKGQPTTTDPKQPAA